MGLLGTGCVSPNLFDARLGRLGVAGALAAVCALDDRLDLLLDALRLGVVQMLEVGRRVGRRARRHHGAPERRCARAAVREVRRLDGVGGAARLGQLRDERDLLAVEMGERGDRRDR